LDVIHRNQNNVHNEKELEFLVQVLVGGAVELLHHLVESLLELCSYGKPSVIKYLCSVPNIHRDQSYGRPLYQEVIGWSLSVWAFVIFMDLSILLAIWAALSISATWISGVILLVLTLYGFFKSQLRITLTQGWLLVGPAAIERAFIFNFKNLNSSEMRNARGVAVILLTIFKYDSGYSTGLKMDLRDPRDKTTAWLISTQNGEKLISLLANPEH
jgi:hypothetical protein